MLNVPIFKLDTHYDTYTSYHLAKSIIIDEICGHYSPLRID